MAKDDLKDLSPQERLKVLKKLEQEKKKEIDEARKLIKESEKDITAEHEFKEKVPIPEVGLENLQGLSEEGRQLLMVLKDLKAKKKEEEPVIVKSVEGESLEETVRRIEPIPVQVQGTEYAIHLSQRPMQDLQNQMKGIYETSQERGYMTSEDQKKVAYLSAGVQHKMEAIDNGSYNASDDLTSRVKATKELSAHMLSKNPDQVYHSGKTEETQRDRYTGREA